MFTSHQQKLLEVKNPRKSQRRKNRTFGIGIIIVLVLKIIIKMCLMPEAPAFVNYTSW